MPDAVPGLEPAALLIESADRSCNGFGSGFAVAHDGAGPLLVTCAHVLQTVGGATQVQVRGLPAEVLACGAPGGNDLALLRVPGLDLGTTPARTALGEAQGPIRVCGYSAFDGTHKQRWLTGALGQPNLLEPGAGSPPFSFPRSSVGMQCGRSSGQKRNGTLERPHLLPRWSAHPYTQVVATQA